MYINGEWVQTSEHLEVINPATGEIVDKVSIGGIIETKNAIIAAKTAFAKWSCLPAVERASYLLKTVEKLKEQREYLAELITKEMGKSIHNARVEVESTISFFQWFAEEARRVYGRTIPANVDNKRITVTKQPVGVVGAITPWNFPLSMIARKLAPALAAGCTVILKPSKEAPLSSLALFKIFDEVEIPKGVVNLVLGQSDKIVGVLMESKDVRKVSFTGSTAIGKQLIRQSANTIKRVSMELGGHAPFIVFEDADIDLAIEGVIQSKFASGGQQCVCANRIYIHDHIYDEFASRLKEKVSRLKVGNGLNESIQIGALINEGAIAKMDEQVTDAISKGASVLYGGERLVGGHYDKGCFYSPTLLIDSKEGMKVLHEETFGPIAPLIRFSSEEEVIQKANNIEYGLASYFYTNDLSRMYRVSEKLEYGMVGINDAVPFSVQAPFGGIKESGLGREGGREGIEDYLDIKMTSTRIQLLKD
ncbi:NAD-dependent succinate-semialdehyde dehydrogenase [Bacillus sp. FJAT-29790]|uniref:NAD-dependent succinate-semialdehyde dehydrogenase n=1 Tax=Bacillus sp. FJAT-29790 TaxID=1895002 RepID=UPI001C216856|nr:NAD-dependent succinate-semialdehyde dehydrogenase [Bacillus sp. FJAT-29790]MBU8878420.1 NAD-dependent succinate-semialdehyde dehydrogenase [Bacillus sp. FJAT-29790]